MYSIKFIQQEIFQATNRPFSSSAILLEGALHLPPLCVMAFRQENGDDKVIPGSFRMLSVKNNQFKRIVIGKLKSGLDILFHILKQTSDSYTRNEVPTCNISYSVEFIHLLFITMY